MRSCVLAHPCTCLEKQGEMNVMEEKARAPVLSAFSCLPEHTRRNAQAHLTLRPLGAAWNPEAQGTHVTGGQDEGGSSPAVSAASL